MTFALTIRSSLVSNMAWFTCRICLGMVIVACFPIAVNGLATEIVHRRQAMPHYFNKHQPICAKIRASSMVTAVNDRIPVDLEVDPSSDLFVFVVFM